MIPADPLLPYLCEIVAQPEAEGIILSGGFGIRLKQNSLTQQQQQRGRQITLIGDIPEARATQDLDIFLNVGIWVEIQKAAALRAALVDRLGYKTVIHSWKLRKPIPEPGDRFVGLDLQSRPPRPDEAVKVAGKPKQVGKGMGTGIAGWQTPEAFAIDESPQSLTVTQDGFTGIVLVPHPYAWLNLKVRAAYDLLRELRGDPDVEPRLTKSGDRVRLKHVFDAYLLTAMLTQDELQASAQLAERYTDHDQARATRQQAAELYGTEDAPGMTLLQQYARRSLGSALQIDHGLFWEEGLRIAVGA